MLQQQLIQRLLGCGLEGGLSGSIFSGDQFRCPHVLQSQEESQQQAEPMFCAFSKPPWISASVNVSLWIFMETAGTLCRSWMLH